MAKQINDNTMNEVVKLYTLGKTVMEITRVLNIGKTTVYRILKQKNVVIDKKRKKVVAHSKVSKISDEIKNKIVESYLNGKYIYQISEQFNLTKYMVSNILKENNIEVKRYIRKTRFSSDEIKEMYNIYSSGRTLNEIAKIYDIDTTEVSLLFRKNNYKVRDHSHAKRIYDIDESYFDNIDTQGKSYFLGLLFADGYNDTNNHKVAIALQEKDRHILESFKKELKTNIPLEFLNLQKKKHTYSNQYRLTICNKRISESLEKLGMVSKKSLVLEFPTMIPDNLISHFIRGYFDGDGHVSRKQYVTSIVSTESFCQHIQQILLNLNIVSRIQNTYNKETTTRTLVMTRKKYCAEFLKYIYDDAKFYLIRKHNIFLVRYINILQTATEHNLVLGKEFCT